MTTTCEHCGGPVPPSKGTGRPRQYCSETHRKAAHEQRRKHSSGTVWECRKCGYVHTSDLAVTAVSHRCPSNQNRETPMQPRINP